MQPAHQQIGERDFETMEKRTQQREEDLSADSAVQSCIAQAMHHKLFHTVRMTWSGLAQT